MTLLDEVNQMALKLMNIDFYYDGGIYNLRKLGWDFKFNTNKRSLGKCRRSTSKNIKCIFLSKWILENGNEPISTWQNTMLHEIAHAIDVERRRTSDHSHHWRSIALSLGCNANRTTEVNYDMDKVVTKYTMVCDTCGHKTPSHKKRNKKVSCGKCGNGSYNEKYLLRQVQNY